MQKIIINKKVHHITGGIILSNKTVSLSTLRIPSHVRSFSCQQCGSCCLEKWRIEIDPATYKQVAAIYESQQQDNVFHELMTKDDQGKTHKVSLYLTAVQIHSNLVKYTGTNIEVDSYESVDDIPLDEDLGNVGGVEV